MPISEYKNSIKLTYLLKPRDAFRGQSNRVPFHMFSMVSCLELCSYTRCFSDIRLQKYRDLDIRVTGHSRSLKVVPFDRLGVVSY